VQELSIAFNLMCPPFRGAITWDHNMIGMTGSTLAGCNNSKTSITAPDLPITAKAIKNSTFLQSKYIALYSRTQKLFHEPYPTRDLNLTSILRTKTAERENSWHSL